ncbi:hypothetical protein EI94DRAFT_1727857 [Lactarius quietus]|nr:hypothetical protein EI94DRAFT_1727857 [Lactarius quietus]
MQATAFDDHPLVINVSTLDLIRANRRCPGRKVVATDAASLQKSGFRECRSDNNSLEKGPPIAQGKKKIAQEHRTIYESADTVARVTGGAVGTITASIHFSPLSKLGQEPRHPGTQGSTNWPQTPLGRNPIQLGMTAAPGLHERNFIPSDMNDIPSA